jgi:hypothetical protein
MRFPEDDYWPFAGAPIVGKSSFVLVVVLVLDSHGANQIRLPASFVHGFLSARASFEPQRLKIEGRRRRTRTIIGRLRVRQSLPNRPSCSVP